MKQIFSIILFIISIVSVSGKEVDMSGFDARLAEELTVMSTVFELDFTNNTKKAVDRKLIISSLKKLDGSEWKVIALDEMANSYNLMAKMWDDIYPRMTYRYSRPIRQMIGKDRFDEGKYLITFEFDTTAAYSLRQGGSIELEFEVKR